MRGAILYGPGDVRYEERAAPGQRVKRAQTQLILELFVEDSWRNVYAGELEVRPPGAPTIPGLGDR